VCKRGAYTLFACGCTLHSGSVVDCEGDSLVESSVVHLPSTGQVGPSCDENNILCLCFSLVMPFMHEHGVDLLL
jgi:hypothetical protein